METMRQDYDISSHQLCGQQGEIVTCLSGFHQSISWDSLVLTLGTGCGAELRLELRQKLKRHIIHFVQTK